MLPPPPDAIADCVLAAFDCLPDKRKPRPRGDGAREWVPLAGIVLVNKGMARPMHATLCSRKLDAHTSGKKASSRAFRWGA